MILLNDATSPFGRKVMVAALEREIALRETFVDLATDATLAASNPLRQIPTLVLEDGNSLYDSDVILAYLDTRHDGPPLIPAERRWQMMTEVALASGMIEATLNRIMEVRRPDGERSPDFITKLEDRIWRTVDALSGREMPSPGSVLRADDITLFCALEYLDFRFTQDWRQRAPALDAWHAATKDRASFVVTRPTRTSPAGS